MVKVGDKIRILGFQTDSDGTLPVSEQKLIGKTGVVEYIDDCKNLHGTWGGIAILPEDKYEVIP